ncbi:MAG: hypothetical protein LBG06_00125 [Deltaproteobacteria bacterium]|jgi:hypothetical protein|nr:hypothetical protein [Deltaproteobacteria bacterium]
MMLLRGQGIEHAASIMKVGWHTINGILQGRLERKHSRSELRKIRRIGIDETYIGGRGKAVTIGDDLDSGDPVFVGDGKSGTALKPLWELLGGRRGRIEAVPST